jgi:hypothetical protein
VVKKKNKVKCWMHDPQDINCILKLDDRVMVCPIALPVLSILEEEEEW